MWFYLEVTKSVLLWLVFTNPALAPFLSPLCDYIDLISCSLMRLQSPSICSAVFSAAVHLPFRAVPHPRSERHQDILSSVKLRFQAATFHHIKV